MCMTDKKIPHPQDPVNGALLAGSWAVRETFVAVVTTNLPMVFPLFKTWLTPLFGSLLTSMRSTQKIRDEPSRAGNRTFGGGVGTKQSWRGRGAPTVNPITNITFTESEEKMVDEVKLQELKAWSDSGESNGPGRAPTSKIRRHVEVEVVSESIDDHHRPGDEESLPIQGTTAFARGPQRTSSYGGNRS